MAAVPLTKGFVTRNCTVTSCAKRHHVALPLTCSVPERRALPVHARTADAASVSAAARSASTSL